MTNFLKSIRILMVFSLAVVVWFGCGDDDKGTNTSNTPPSITSISADPDTFIENQHTSVTVVVTDPDGDNLQYTWQADASWLAWLQGANPARFSNCCVLDSLSTSLITVTVSDGQGGQDSDTIRVWAQSTGK